MFKMLVAEDDSLQIALYKSWMCDILAEYPGAIVTMLSDGNDINCDLKSSEYDITVLDVALPKKSGIDIYRENSSRMGVIVLSSSYSDVFKSYLNAGDKCIILNKPCTKEQFCIALHKAMEALGHVKHGTTGSGEKLSTID